MVRRYAGCLGILPRRERRVLELRAGVGPRRPASRARVSRRLDLSVRRVARIERRALRTLERDARDGCTLAPGAEFAVDETAIWAAGDGAVLAAAGSRGTAGTAGTVATGGADAPAGGSGGERSPRARPRAGTEDQGGVAGITAVSPPPPSATPAGTDVTIPVLLVVLAGMALFALRHRPGRRLPD